jgi:cyclopropane-fatty-acyl-phospholipid synthase
VRAEGLNDRITILLMDYRKMDGVYDKIVSIEMLEAVGHQYLGRFFACVDRLLKPGGLLVIQAITIPDERYQQYLSETDWFQKHIFPGGELLSLSAIKREASEHSSLLMESIEEIGPDYARTLQDWRRRFTDNLGMISAMGFDRTFQRKWLYYLATCEAGFVERALGDIQVVFRKP